MNLTKEQKHVVLQALNCIRESVPERGETMGRPEDSELFCKLRLASENSDQEHFLVLYMDNQHQLITDRIEFHGTIDSANVYPRIIAKHALEFGAAAVILSHNHPSGILKPSESDKLITEKIKNGLALFDIRVLDHIIIADNQAYSFAQNGVI